MTKIFSCKLSAIRYLRNEVEDAPIMLSEIIGNDDYIDNLYQLVIDAGSDPNITKDNLP